MTNTESLVTTPERRALIIGGTGISGQAVVRKLLHDGWTVYSTSRNGATAVDGAVGLAVDLLKPETVHAAAAEASPELVVIAAWVRKATEAENIEVNGTIVRNVLNALRPTGTVRHVALLTGLKHYLGPFEFYGKGVNAETPFHESELRLAFPNFYYTQEDELFAASEHDGFTWSVHRAHTIFGFATGNAMNMALTLSVYATLCAERKEPFVFPGSEAQWNGVTDITDADLLGEQVVWAGTSPAGENQAFNIANGDVFRWRWLWPRLAAYFGLEWEGFNTEPRPLEARMDGAAEQWAEIAARHGLVEPDIDRLASWWHTDADLGRTIECFTDMTKSKEAGFLGFRSTAESFFDKVERYRAAHILP